MMIGYPSLIAHNKHVTSVQGKAKKKKMRKVREIPDDFATVKFHRFWLALFLFFYIINLEFYKERMTSKKIIGLEEKSP